MMPLKYLQNGIEDGQRWPTLTNA